MNRFYIGGGEELIIKFIIALLSAVVSSFILTIMFYNPSFGNGFPIFLSITGPAYLLGGISCSLLINRFTENLWMKLIYFIIAGFIVGIITILVFISFLNSPPPEIWRAIINGIIVGLYGSVSALIFYLIELLINGLKGKLFS
jgi:hypothetical protein